MTQIATCPEVGVWRAWLDHEPDDATAAATTTTASAPDAPILEAHLRTCPGCRRLVAELREDAAFVHTTLGLLHGPLPTPAETALARERLAWRRRGVAAAAGARRDGSGWGGRLAGVATGWRVAASGLAAAVALSLFVATVPEARTAAAAFLAQFRSEQVAAVEITPQSQADIARTLSALADLGTFDGPRPGALRGQEQRPVSLDEASRAVGFALKTPDPATLPAGLSAAPRITVVPAAQERFTFHKAQAAAHLQATGHPAVNLPDKFDGASVVVSIPSAALLQYGTGSDASRQALVIGEAGPLLVETQGNVSLDELRDFLLGLPGLPPDVVRQLRQMGNWTQTLPVPVPVDQVHWRPASFPNGGQGLLLDDNSGIGSAAIWQAGGHLYGVAGSVKAVELKRVADSLATR